MVCLKMSDPVVKRQLGHLEEIFGDADIAYYLLSANNGFDLELTPEGKPSQLYQDLLQQNGGNPQQALVKKSYYYTQAYLKQNNWLETNVEPTIAVQRSATPAVELQVEEAELPEESKVTKADLNSDSETTGNTQVLEQLESEYLEQTKGVTPIAVWFANKTGSIKQKLDMLDKLPATTIAKNWIYTFVKSVKDNIGWFVDEMIDEGQVETIRQKIVQNYHVEQQRPPQFTAHEWSQHQHLAETLRTLFPKLSVKVDKIAEEYTFGIIDFDAMQILIDFATQKRDTLPHEYLHYYIEMFEDSDEVQTGLKRFGSMEQLIQAIGEEVVRRHDTAFDLQESVDGTIMSIQDWISNFKDFLRRIFGLGLTKSAKKAAQDQIVRQLALAFLQNKTLSPTVRELTGKRRQSEAPVKNITMTEARQKLAEIATRIDKASSDSDVYVDKRTGAEMERVTNVAERLGYSSYDAANEDEYQAMLSENQRTIGTMIHKIAEDIMLDRFNRSNYPNFSDNAIKGIRELVNELMSNKKLVASEAVVADFDKHIAGTADLILQNPSTGKYVLADFKTKLWKLNGKQEKENKKRLWGFKWVFSKAYSSKNTRDKWDFQLSMYQYMLEKLGFQFEKRVIVPIMYDANITKDGYFINNVFKSKEIGTVELTDDDGFVVNKDKTVDFDVNVKVFQDQEKSGVDVDAARTLVDRLEILTKELTDQLRAQSKILRLQGRTNQAREAEYTLARMNNVSEADLFVKYLTHAAKQLKRFTNAMEGITDETKWNLDALRTYKEIAEAYTNIKSIQDYTREYKDVFTKKQIEDIDKLCGEVLMHQSKILGAYEEKGLSLYINEISKYVDNIRQQYIAEAKKKFADRNKDSKKAINYRREQDKFVQKYLSDHLDEIQYKTKRWLREMRSLADQSFECTALAASFGSVYQSKNTFVQAAILAFEKEIQAAERESLQTRQMCSNLLKEFRAKYGYTSTANQKAVWGDMVEEFDGQAYLVSEIANEFVIALNKFNDELKNDTSLTRAEKNKRLAEWQDKHNPIVNKAAYDLELKQGLEQIFSDLTETQKKTINQELNKKPEDRVSWWQYYYKNQLSSETTKALEKLEATLNANHRRPNPTIYKNEKFKKLEQLKATDDVKWRMYKFLADVDHDGNSGVASFLKLKGRLPGVRKDILERTSENGVLNAASSSLKESFNVMADDTLRGDFVDMNGRKLLQVPLFFSNKLGVEDQSFDLPTIYMKWYQAAATHKAKKRVESLIIHTNYILQTMQVETGKASLLARKSKQDQQSKKAAQNTAEQWEAWMEQVFYENSMELDSTVTGVTESGIDKGKIFNMLLNYYSLRTMAGNYISGINNALIGEVQRLEEAMAGEYISMRSYHKASKLFAKEALSMLQDVGKPVPEHKYNKLVEYFGLFDRSFGSMKNRGFFANSVTDISYWTTNVGEREMQTRFLLGTLCELQAKDENGNVLGDMLDFIDIDENGSLIVDDKVANFGQEEVFRFSTMVRAALLDIDGNYDTRMKVALQAKWYGKIALTLRKWIYSTSQRRFTKHYFDNIRQKDFEGFYNTGASWIFMENPWMNGMANFIKQLIFGAEAAKIQCMRWDELEDWQKSNIKRFVTEISVMLSALAISTILGVMRGEDDDDDTFADLIYDNIQYQMYRLWTDLSFYTNPASFAKILQDPFPTMTLLTDVTKLISQLTDPLEVYESGSRVGQNKLLYQLLRFVPGYRQIDRWMHVDEEMELFRRVW